MADSEMRFDGKTWLMAGAAGGVLWMSGFVLVAGWTSVVEAVGGWLLLAIVLGLGALAVGVPLAIYGMQTWRGGKPSDIEAEAADARRRDTHRGFGTDLDS